MNFGSFTPSPKEESKGSTSGSSGLFGWVGNFFSKKPSSNLLPASQKGNAGSGGSSWYGPDIEMQAPNAFQTQKMSHSCDRKYQDSLNSYQIPNSSANFNVKDSNRVPRYVQNSRHPPSNLTPTHKRISPNLSGGYFGDGLANQGTHKNKVNTNLDTAKGHMKPKLFASDINAHGSQWQNNFSCSQHGNAQNCPKIRAADYVSPYAKEVPSQQRDASSNRKHSPHGAQFMNRNYARGSEKLKLANDSSQNGEPSWSQKSLINLNAEEEETKKLRRGDKKHQTGGNMNKDFASRNQGFDVENIDTDTSLSKQTVIKLSVSDETKQPHKNGKNKQPNDNVDNVLAVCDDKPRVYNNKSGNGSSNAHASRLNIQGASEEDAKNTILRRLQQKLKTEYESSMKRCQSWLTTNKSWNVLFAPFLCARNKSLENASFIELMRSILKEGSNTLLVGEPGFGKSTLCSIMANKWANSIPPLGGFELCLVLPCKNLSLYDGDSLGSKLVTYCSALVGVRKSNDNVVMNALFSLRMKTLIILEDYDECEQSFKELINEFLKRKGIVDGATVLMTTRPLLKEHDLFDKRVNMVLELGGYSNVTLKSLLETEGKYYSSFQILDDDRKFHYLIGMTPRFTTQVSKAVPLFHSELHKTKNRSLYNLIDYVLDCFWSSSHGRPSPSQGRESSGDRVLLDLGKLFFEALLTRRFKFSEGLLKDVLKESHQNIVDCQIIIKDREHETDQIWFPATKLWMVFLATKYLKHLWGKCKTNLDRAIFLKNVLCCGAYNGEFVFCKKVYYVGLIPEIVLSFGDGSSLDKAKVEMFYDVERIECSQAFDSINMLLRVHEKYLSRYSFEKCSAGDLETQRIFKSVLSNSNADVMFEFFRNVYENRYFAHGTITDGNGDSILSALYRGNDATEIDRVHIRFCSFYLTSVFSSLKNVLSKCVPESDLSESLNDGDIGELIYNLIFSLSNKLPTKLSIVSWGYQPENTPQGFKMESSLEIIPKDAENVIQYSTRCLSRDLLHSESECYNILQFEDKKPEIIGKIMGTISKTRKPFVNIDLFL